MRTPWELVLLAALAALLLFAGLGSMALTDRDEGANAEAAREMLERQAWITPTLNYAPRFAKPAFVYWLTAAAYAGLGVSEASARLPSAVAGAALVLVQYAVARWAFGPATGLRAALILLLSVEFVVVSRMALTDATLVLWTTVAGYGFFRAHHRPADDRSRPWSYLVVYAALALAMLTKGPVGVLVPVASIAVYVTLAGRWRQLLHEARPLWGLAVFLLIAAPWYGAMLQAHGWSYVSRARGETVGRVFRSVTGPGGTLLFYVPVVLVGLFPWSALLPGALVEGLRGARARARADRQGAAVVFAASWVVTVLVLFSLFESRLPHYALPLFPFAALLVAATWPATWPALARMLLGALAVLLASVTGAAVAAGPTLAGLLASAYPAAPGAALPPTAYGVAAVLLAIAAVAVLRPGAHAFSTLAGLATLLLALGVHVALPAFSTRFVAPAGVLAIRLGREARPCDQLVALGPYRPSLLFYARRPITFLSAREIPRLASIGSGSARPGAGAPEIALDQRRWLVLTPVALLGLLPPELARLPRVDARGGYVALASAPVAGACPPGAAPGRM